MLALQDHFADTYSNASDESVTEEQVDANNNNETPNNNNAAEEAEENNDYGGEICVFLT